MEVVYERVAAIDVGKKIIAVAVRTPGEKAGKRRQQVRKYNTFHQTLTEMVSWLVSEGVTHVTMEATGVYWRPVFHALCAAEEPPLRPFTADGHKAACHFPLREPEAGL